MWAYKKARKNQQTVVRIQSVLCENALRLKKIVVV